MSTISHNENDKEFSMPNFAGKTVLTGFSAYVRKPIGVNDGGNKAQFYAESGDNANIVCQFSTNYYWGQTVNVNVYLIKNRDGVLMKENDEFPLIASFIGRIEHPLHKNSDGGQTAVFYAEQGEDGDIVSKFMEDQYVDALVYIELRGMLAIHQPDIFEENSQKEILENHMFNLSEGERKEYDKNKMKYESLNIQFQEFALSNPKVLKIIEQMVEKGEYMSFADYMKNVFLSERTVSIGVDNHCFHSERCYNPVSVDNVYYFNPNDKYSIVCLCEEHKGNLALPSDNLLTRFQAKSLLNKKRWMWNYFVKEFSYSGKHHPDSRLLYHWLMNNDLLDLVSKSFIKGIQKLEKL